MSAKGSLEALKSCATEAPIASHQFGLLKPSYDELYAIASSLQHSRDACPKPRVSNIHTLLDSSEDDSTQSEQEEVANKLSVDVAVKMVSLLADLFDGLLQDGSIHKN